MTTCSQRDLWATGYFVRPAAKTRSPSDYASSFDTREERNLDQDGKVLEMTRSSILIRPPKRLAREPDIER